MKSKKGQSEVITTVLIILLVLAAIVIVWGVVQFIIKDTTKKSEVMKGCVGLELTVTKATSSSGTDNIIVRREGPSTTKDVKVKLLVNDKYNQTSSDNLNSTYMSTFFSVGGLNANVDNVQVVPVLSDGTSCAISEKFQVTSD